MVIHNQCGQSTTEYVLMLSILTLVGFLIMKGLVGTNFNADSGSVPHMSVETAKKIAKD